MFRSSSPVTVDADDAKGRAKFSTALLATPAGACPKVLWSGNQMDNSWKPEGTHPNNATSTEGTARPAGSSATQPDPYEPGSSFTLNTTAPASPSSNSQFDGGAAKPWAPATYCATSSAPPSVTDRQSSPPVPGPQSSPVSGLQSAPAVSSLQSSPSFPGPQSPLSVSGAHSSVHSEPTKPVEPAARPEGAASVSHTKPAAYSAPSKDSSSSRTPRPPAVPAFLNKFSNYHTSNSKLVGPWTSSRLRAPPPRDMPGKDTTPLSDSSKGGSAATKSSTSSPFSVLPSCPQPEVPNPPQPVYSATSAAPQPAFTATPGAPPSGFANQSTYLGASNSPQSDFRATANASQSASTATSGALQPASNATPYTPRPDQPAMFGSSSPETNGPWNSPPQDRAPSSYTSGYSAAQGDTTKTWTSPTSNTPTFQSLSVGDWTQSSSHSTAQISGKDSTAWSSPYGNFGEAQTEQSNAWTATNISATSPFQTMYGSSAAAQHQLSRPWESASKPWESAPSILESTPKPWESAPKPWESELNTNSPKPWESELNTNSPQFLTRPSEFSPRRKESLSDRSETAYKPWESAVKAWESASNAWESASKAWESASTRSETIFKPWESASALSETASKPRESASKPFETAYKPLEEASTWSKGATKPWEFSSNTDTSFKPWESASRLWESTSTPSETASKPLESSAKPWESVCKLLDATPTSSGSTLKSWESAAKPTESKPSASARRPCEFEYRPWEAVPKPGKLASGSLDATPRPWDSAPTSWESARSREAVRSWDTTSAQTFSKPDYPSVSAMEASVPEASSTQTTEPAGQGTTAQLATSWEQSNVSTFQQTIPWQAENASVHSSSYGQTYSLATGTSEDWTGQQAATLTNNMSAGASVTSMVSEQTTPKKTSMWESLTSSRLKSTLGLGSSSTTEASGAAVEKAGEQATLQSPTFGSKLKSASASNLFSYANSILFGTLGTSKTPKGQVADPINLQSDTLQSGMSQSGTSQLDTSRQKTDSLGLETNFGYGNSMTTETRASSAGQGGQQTTLQPDTTWQNPISASTSSSYGYTYSSSAGQGGQQTTLQPDTTWQNPTSASTSSSYGYTYSMASGSSDSWPTFQPGYQSTVQPGNQATMQSSNQSALQPGSQSSQATIQSGNQATLQQGYQSTLQPGYQATTMAGYQAAMQPSIQATVQPGSQTTVQPGNQTTPQTGYQSTLQAYAASDGVKPGETTTPVEKSAPEGSPAPESPKPAEQPAPTDPAKEKLVNQTTSVARTSGLALLTRQVLAPVRKMLFHRTYFKDCKECFAKLNMPSAISQHPTFTPPSWKKKPISELATFDTIMSDYKTSASASGKDCRPCANVKSSMRTIAPAILITGFGTVLIYTVYKLFSCRCKGNSRRRDR